jgi:hypothetical protein
VPDQLSTYGNTMTKVSLPTMATQGVHYPFKPRITCVHAPYQNTHVYILFLLKSSNILTNLIASKYISIRTQGSKNKYKIVYDMCTNVWKCKNMALLYVEYQIMDF